MYALTYVLSEKAAGRGYFGHISTFLTKLGEDNKLEVYPLYGYYGVPSTSSPDSIKGKLKRKFKLNLDFTGSHSMLLHEKMQNFDKGCGLKARSIELYPEQFDALFQKYEMKKKKEFLAIAESAESLGIKERSEKYKLYPEEKYSYQIFEHEQKRAKENGDESRLKPYGFVISLGLSGIDFNESGNCKSAMLDFLKDTLSPEQINQFTENGVYPVRPARSGELEEILLHSSGPLSDDKNGTQKIRKFGTGAKLYWTIPPQLISRLPVSAFPPPIDNELCLKMKETARILQALEAIIRNAALNNFKLKKYSMSSNHIEMCRENLISTIVKHYEVFSFVEPRRSDSTSGRFFDNRELASLRIKNNLQKAGELLHLLQLELTKSPSEQNTNMNKPEKFLRLLSNKDKQTILELTRTIPVSPTLSKSRL